MLSDHNCSIIGYKRIDHNFQIIIGVICIPTFKNRDHEALSPRFREPLLDYLIEKLVDVGDEDKTSNFKIFSW